MENIDLSKKLDSLIQQYKAESQASQLQFNLLGKGLFGSGVAVSALLWNGLPMAALIIISSVTPLIYQQIFSSALLITMKKKLCLKVLEKVKTNNLIESDPQVAEGIIGLVQTLNDPHNTISLKRMLKGFVLMMKFMHSSTDMAEYTKEIKNFLGSQGGSAESPTADERNVSVLRDATETASSKTQNTMEDAFTEASAGVSPTEGEKIASTLIDMEDKVNHVKSTASQSLSENEIRIRKNYMALVLKERILQNGNLMSCL